MKKWFKKFVAVTTATTMMLSLAFTQLPDMAPIFADDGTTTNSGNGGSYSITVHPYYYGGTSTIAGNGKENQGVPDGATQENVSRNFKITEVDSDGKDKTDGYTTNASGTTAIRFENLTRGYYKVEPVYTGDAAALNGINSFIVQLPMADSTVIGNGENSIIKDVHVYPKDLFPKDDDDSGNGNGNYDDGDGDTTNDTKPEDDTTTENDDVRSAIKLIKVDAENNDTKLSGAKYALYYYDGKDYIKSTGNYETDSDGKIVITDLPYGKYYLVETKAPDGYLLDQTPVKFELSSAIPHVVRTHTNDDKLEVDKIFDKLVEKDNKEVYIWTITAEVPSKVENLLSYEITEIPGEAIETVTFESVEQGDKIFVENTDYTVEENVLKFKGQALDTLNPNTPLKITVSSTLKTDANKDSITNDVSIKYRYAYNPDTTDDVKDIPDIPDPDKDDDSVITPDDKGEGGEEQDDNYDDKFPVQEDKTPGVDGGGGDSPTVSNHEITIVLIDENGGNITDKTAKFNIYNTSGDLVKSDVDNGDKVKLPVGEYVIKQVTAPDGYVFNEEELTVTVDENTGSGENAKEVEFTNDTKTTFELPFTGTTATIVFFTLGILIMMTSVFFMIIIIKKKNQDEDKDKNSTV